jgi:hypothetical protein
MSVALLFTLGVVPAVPVALHTVTVGLRVRSCVVLRAVGAVNSVRANGRVIPSRRRCRQRRLRRTSHERHRTSSGETRDDAVAARDVS